jgi:hypothetical protein
VRRADFTRTGHVTLGRTYRDKVTGFVGVATGRHEYLTGCVRFALEAVAAEPGKPPEDAVFDEGRLVEVEWRRETGQWVLVEVVDQTSDADPAAPAKGGPRSVPSRPRVPAR